MQGQAPLGVGLLPTGTVQAESENSWGAAWPAGTAKELMPLSPAPEGLTMGICSRSLGDVDYVSVFWDAGRNSYWQLAIRSTRQLSETCKFALQHDSASLTWLQEVAAGEKVVVVHWSGAPPLDRGQSVHHLVWHTPEPALGASVGV